MAIVRTFTGYGVTNGVAAGRIVRTAGHGVPGTRETLDEKLLLAYSRNLSVQEISQLSAEQRIAGLILPEPRQYTHASCLLNHLTIPAIAFEDIPALPDGAFALLDAAGSQLVVAESSYDRHALENRLEAEIARASRQAAQWTSPIADVQLQADLLSPEYVPAAIAVGAEGVGEIRPELVHSPGGLDPNHTRNILQILRKSTLWRPLPVRFFDYGADKPISGDNADPALSALGVRGIRSLQSASSGLGARFADILRETPPSEFIAVLPMVARPQEIKMFREAYPGDLAMVGIEAETPSCALEIDAFLDQVHYVTVGPCDLTQFTLGMDRRLISPRVIAWDRLAPAVIELTRHVVYRCRASGLEAAISLDLRPSFGLLQDIRATGIRRLTVPPWTIPVWRRLFSSTRLPSGH